MRKKFNHLSPMALGKRWLLVLTVVTVLLHGTHGQSHHFVIGHYQRNFDQLFRELDNSGASSTASVNSTETDLELDSNDTNSTVIVVQNSVRGSSNELSQTAMDVITIVWYVATFLALAAFFLLMACSDRRCSDSVRNNASNETETPNSPPTPTPSYSEFAPPSYDSVMKIQHENRTSVFVIAVHLDQSPKDGTSASPQVDTPTINVYTINELQKLSS